MTIKTEHVKEARSRAAHERLVRELATMKATVADLRQENAQLSELLDITEAVEQAGCQPMMIEPLRKNAVAEGAVLAVLSDCHAYETVRPEQVSGLNEHTAAVSRARQGEFFRTVAKWAKIHRHGIELPTCVLAILGDTITNQLHEDQVEGNEGTVQEEVLFELEVLSGGIEFLLKHGGFEQIRVVCVDGNHGRGTEKLRHANRVQHSHEWLMYRMLQKLYDGRAGVEFVIAEGLHTYIELFDRVVRFHHGDAVKYQGGIGGITIPVNKAIGEWNKGRRADLDVFGHWHQAIYGQNFLCNGSTVGYSPYSLGIKAPFEPPTQWFCVANKGPRWITSYNKIIL